MRLTRHSLQFIIVPGLRNRKPYGWSMAFSGFVTSLLNASFNMP